MKQPILSMGSRERRQHGQARRRQRHDHSQIVSVISRRTRPLHERRRWRRQLALLRHLRVMRVTSIAIADKYATVARRNYKQKRIMRSHEASSMSDEFDPRRSIFLPKTSNPLREFSNWETAIFMRRGELFTLETSPEEQQSYYDELQKVRAWWLARAAEALTELAS